MIDVWRDGRGGVTRIEAWAAHAVVELDDSGEVRVVVETYTPDGRIAERRTWRLRSLVEEVAP